MSSELFRKFAEELKATREKKEITLQQISNKTRINIKFLEAIEEGNFGIIDEIYIRAFLREYAQFIDLEEKEILRRYEQCKAGRFDEPEKIEIPVKEKVENSKEEEPDTPQARKMDLEEPKNKFVEHDKKKEQPAVKDKNDVFSENSNKKQTNREPSKSTSKHPGQGTAFFNYVKSLKGNTPVLTGLVAGVLVIFVIIYFAFIRDSKPQFINERPYEEVMKEQALKSELTSPEEKLSEIKADSLTLTIAASDTSWIRAVSDDSKTEEFILLPGHSKKLKSSIDFNLLIGNSRGIELYLNEKSLNFKGKVGGVKNIIVDKNGFRLATTREPSSHE